MRSVKSAIDQANLEFKRKQEAEIEREENRKKHSGPKADQRVDYMKDLLKKERD